MPRKICQKLRHMTIQTSVALETQDQDGGHVSTTPSASGGIGTSPVAVMGRLSQVQSDTEDPLVDFLRNHRGSTGTTALPMLRVVWR